MSRGRRLIALWGLMLLAVGWAARPGRAQSTAPTAGDVPGAPAPRGADGPGGLIDLPETLAPTPAADPPPGGPEGFVIGVPAPAGNLDLPAALPGDPTIPTRPEPPPAMAAEAPYDPQVQPAQAPPASAAPAGSPFLVAPERLRDGLQNVGVSVQVLAPPAMNVNKPAKIAIVVKNTGAADALGVVVRDQLPPGTQFVEARPAPEGDTSGGLLVWSLGDLAPGVERRLDVTVNPTATGNLDHAATVHFLSGSRARTLVQEPKLRVEQTASRGPILRGEQVQFDIVITNTGTGPARNVLIRAELSEGLTHPSEGRVLELDLASTDLEAGRKAVLGPGETVRLPALFVDTLGGGEQTCTVKVTSPDVVESPEATSVQTVTVVEPKLDVAVDGPTIRYTELDAEYTITVTNPGTAVARSVRLTATLVGDARPYQPARGGVWDGSRRTITWDLPQLALGETQTFPLRVRLGGVGVFQVNAEAAGAGPGLKDHAGVATSVEANADLELDVTQDLRLFDVGRQPVFTLKVRNIGSKEARQVKVKAQLSDTLKPVETAGTEEQAGVEDATNTVVFPTIERLPAGNEITLYIRAEAVAAGLATCRAFLTHQDIQYEVEDVANAQVIDSTRR